MSTPDCTPPTAALAPDWPAGDFVAGDRLPPDAWHAAFNAAFADYVAGPIQLAPAQWPGFLARQGIDLARSRAAVVDGQIQAFALAAPRPALAPPRWRLGTMGAVPAARGTGLAPRLLDDFVARAREHGAGVVELEVFAANTPAVRLYASRGFEVAHPLRGYARPPLLAAHPEAGRAEAVPLAQAWAWLDAVAQRVPDLPLQVTTPVLRVADAAAPGTVQAWRSGGAQAVFADRPGEAAVLLLSLVDTDPHQRGAHALAQALAARHPGRALRMPPLQRPDLGGDALARAGWAIEPMHQWLMRCVL